MNCLKISKYLFLNMFRGSSYLKKLEEIIYHHLNAIKNKLCLGKINKHDYHSCGWFLDYIEWKCQWLKFGIIIGQKTVALMLSRTLNKMDSILVQCFRLTTNTRIRFVSGYIIQIFKPRLVSRQLCQLEWEKGNPKGFWYLQSSYTIMHKFVQDSN